MVMPRRRRNNKQTPTNIQIPHSTLPGVTMRKPANRKDMGDFTLDENAQYLEKSKRVSPNRRRTARSKRRMNGIKVS